METGQHAKDMREGRLHMHPRSAAKMKARIKELTSRSNGWGNDRRKEAHSRYIKGCVQYFRLADMKNLLGEMMSGTTVDCVWSSGNNGNKRRHEDVILRG